MVQRKKIAAIITTFYPASHADVIIAKFVNGFPTDEGLLPPKVDIVSMYMDQVHQNDIGLDLAEKNSIPVYPSVRQALCLGGSELAVDGVLSIGEHGDYAWNEKEQHLYPRRYFFEQIAGVIATSGRPVPVFNDKHLSYNWYDAKWMYDRAQKLNIPFMAGSSVPLFWRNPWLEHSLETNIEEALVLSYGGLDAYGYHAFEALQAMVERRIGGETGVVAVQCLEGEAVWQAGNEGLWSRDLAEAATLVGETKEGNMEELCEEPIAFLIEYKDGLKAAVLHLRGFANEWSYASRVDGEIQATGMRGYGPPYPPFSYLGLNIQEMFLTGIPQYPVERTLLVSGGLEALLDSRYRGYVRLETPHLDVVYQAYEKAPIRSTNPFPSGASKGLQE
ncbi:TPA: hypothetical protein EYN09_03545 [Candidatus Poribacteria bacterium]|nr:hypothetical protein [Candidatus Poribacteria bacterium]HIO05987.1 hypothetical protein [Candidatus Poribacteria bacterium]